MDDEGRDNNSFDHHDCFVAVWLRRGFAVPVARIDPVRNDDVFIDHDRPPPRPPFRPPLVLWLRILRSASASPSRRGREQLQDPTRGRTVRAGRRRWGPLRYAERQQGACSTIVVLSLLSASKPLSAARPRTVAPTAICPDGPRAQRLQRRVMPVRRQRSAMRHRFPTWSMPGPCRPPRS